VPANRVPRKRRLPVEADRSSAERTRLLLMLWTAPPPAHRCLGLWRGAALQIYGFIGLVFARKRARISLAATAAVLPWRRRNNRRLRNMCRRGRGHLSEYRSFRHASVHYQRQADRGTIAADATFLAPASFYESSNRATIIHDQSCDTDHRCIGWNRH
jgi:hypothetical protein